VSSAILFAIVALIFGVVGFFLSSKTAKQDAKILDLTVKINENKDAAAAAQKDADAKVKAYQDSLAKLNANNKPPTDGGGSAS